MTRQLATVHFLDHWRAAEIAAGSLDRRGTCHEQGQHRGIPPHLPHTDTPLAIRGRAADV